MKKTYQTPDADLVVFKPAQDLAITWSDMNEGVTVNQPQAGAMASAGDIIVKL